jgi:uncharacterized protein with HEPN domain
MTRSANERVADILDAIDKCARFRTHLADAAPDVAEMAFDAALRNIAVIGEAANRLPAAIIDAHPELDWPAIVAMRNVLVHQYFGVNAALVERVLERNLQPLAEALRPHLGE